MRLARVVGSPRARGRGCQPSRVVDVFGGHHLAADGRRRAMSESTVGAVSGADTDIASPPSVGAMTGAVMAASTAGIGALPGARTRTSRQAPPGAPGTALIRVIHQL